MAGKISSLDLSERQRYGLAFLRHRNALINVEYCRINDCDSRIAAKELTELVQHSIILQHGTRRWTRYTLNEPSKEQKPAKTKRGDRRKAILEVIASQGESTRQDIQDKLKMPGVTIPYWLRRLIHDGEIERTTALKSRHARYRASKRWRKI